MTAYDYYSLAQGAVVTVCLSLVSIAIGLPLGLLLALVRWRGVPVLERVVAVLVSLLRASPAVTLGLLIFFALPVAGIEIGTIPAAVMTLTLSTAAFNCEIWRGALVEFPRDQLDAARAAGMTAGLRLRLIVLPQIVRTAMPALVNEMTLLVKASPAVAVIGVVDITRAAVRIGANTYEPLPPFLAATVIYGTVVFLFVIVQRTVEARQRRATAA